jgi:1,4-dihydroxy-2-naphthoate octaprenyltransferase
MSETITETSTPWTDDTPAHELLSKHAEAPLIETSVSKVIAAPIGDVYDHFFGSQPELRLDLHKDHVKSYHINNETDSTLEYEYVFEAYGARNWGKAVEVGDKPNRIDVEVTEGPLQGQSIVMLLRVVEGGTEVTQVNRVWPGRNELLVKMMGGSLKSRLAALAGVHLEQHRTDIETDGTERFQDKFSKDHQQKLEQSKKNPIVDLLSTSRAITLPIILMPILAAAAVASIQGVFDPLVLTLTLIGGAAALMGANILNDLWDFRGGADQATRTVPGAIETGSGVFVEGKWSLKKGWAVTGALFGVAFVAGAALAIYATPWVLVFAAGGFLISYIYVGPPFPLAYKGRGLGELAIFVAFGILPVVGGVVAYGGLVNPLTWWVAALFGLTSSIVLYHHHFLHWMSDKLAGKSSPVAVLGPQRGALVGLAWTSALLATLGVGAYTGAFPWIVVLAGFWPLLMLVRPELKVAGGDDSPPARQRLAAAAFFAVFFTDLTLVLTLWLA